MTNNGLTLLWVIGGGVGLYFFGKTVRRWTKNSSCVPFLTRLIGQCTQDGGAFPLIPLKCLLPFTF